MEQEKFSARRNYSAQFRTLVLEQCAAPGASVAKVALSHGMNANVVHRWRQLARRAGLFQAANRGTLFLDEIGDMPLALQVKLLRVLQERMVRPLGATRSESVDVRLLSATHRDLDAAMAQGQFREDLYYRLDVVSLTLPRLEERREDIPPLAAHFVQQVAGKYGKPISGFAPDALESLATAAWPGNVRQLENVIERGVVGAAGRDWSDGQDRAGSCAMARSVLSPSYSRYTRSSMTNVTSPTRMSWRTSHMPLPSVRPVFQTHSVTIASHRSGVMWSFHTVAGGMVRSFAQISGGSDKRGIIRSP